MKKKVAVRLRKMATEMQLMVEGKKPIPESKEAREFFLSLSLTVKKRIKAFHDHHHYGSKFHTGSRRIYQILKELHYQGAVRV